MDTQKIIEVVEMYHADLITHGTRPKRMESSKTFKELSEEELLSHAMYLCENIHGFIKDPEKRRKTGSHLTSIQLCLSFVGWYTLDDLMNHNRI